MNLTNLIPDFHSGKLSKEQFLLLYFQDSKLTNQEQMEYLLQDLRSGIGLNIEHALTVLFLLKIYSKFFSPVMCKLLEQDNHFAHENVALYLEELKDPATINCLNSAIEHRFAYLKYDDSYDLAKTCIRALANMATIESLAKLRLLSNNANADEESRESVLADYASYQLELHS